LGRFGAEKAQNAAYPPEPLGKSAKTAQLGFVSTSDIS
jgi:hypothetical protein